MASPNHKAGLAVVLPASDDRAHPRGIMKQNAFTSPRKNPYHSNGMKSNRSLNGTTQILSPSSGVAFSHPSNVTTPHKGPITVSSQHLMDNLAVQKSNSICQPHANGRVSHLPNGLPTQEPKGVPAARRRLLEVDEALQFSPFSSIVPFDPGESCRSTYEKSS